MYAYLETWNSSNVDVTLLTQALLQLPWLSLASILMDTTGWWTPIVTASQLHDHCSLSGHDHCSLSGKCPLPPLSLLTVSVQHLAQCQVLCYQLPGMV